MQITNLTASAVGVGKSMMCYVVPCHICGADAGTAYCYHHYSCIRFCNTCETREELKDLLHENVKHLL